MSKNWNGLVTIEELVVRNEDKIIYETKDLKNILHAGGQELFLGCMFKNFSIPTTYYVGLDSRTNILADQDMNDISGEPNVSGYARQPLIKDTDFSFATTTNPVKIRSSTVVFSYSGFAYSATDMFLCTVATGTSGILISTVSFGTVINVSSSSTSVSMKFAMTLGSC
jgi:hypothetical protein